MGTRRHEIRYGGGDQAVRAVLQRPDGSLIPHAGARYTIVDLRESEDSDNRVIVPESAATIYLPQTTTTAVAGRGGDPDGLELTDATGFEARRSVSVAEDGRTEVVYVRAIEGLRLQLRGELGGLYGIGAAVEGVEVEGTFPAAEADLEDTIEDGGGPYAIDWIAAGGEVVRELIFVVRRDKLTLVDEDWLRRHSPELATQTGRRAELGEALSAAHEHYRADLRAHGIDPAEFDGGEVAQLAVGSLALWILWREIAGDHARELAAQHREQATTWLRHLRIGAPPRDAVETDARTDTRRSPRVRGMSLRM